MHIAHFGHSCILVELERTTILFDPGNYSHGFEGITGLDAIVVTHQHPDHIDPARIDALIDVNPGATLLSDPETARQQGGRWQAVRAGRVIEVGSVRLTGGGGRHAVIHPDIPVVDNTAFLLGTENNPARLLHPGDSLWVPPVSVDVLALPTMAPWMKSSEAVDYLRSVAPRVAFPIHQGLLRKESLPIYIDRFSQMAAPGTAFRVLPAESPVAL